jgi:hypothetical protein
MTARPPLPAIMARRRTPIPPLLVRIMLGEAPDPSASLGVGPSPTENRFMKRKRNKNAKMIIGMVTFVFGVIAGAGAAMWLTPPL